jgi:hypothetical protein
MLTPVIILNSSPDMWSPVPAPDVGADIAARTRPVLDDELLTETFREPLSQQARADVSAAGRRERGTMIRTGRVG